MAAVALAFSIDTAILTYLLVEFGEDNGGELQIPDSISMSELIRAANQLDVLSAGLKSLHTSVRKMMPRLRSASLASRWVVGRFGYSEMLLPGPVTYAPA
jgi:hypothetical protein